MPNILIVDDEASIRKILLEVLAEEGYSATAVESGEACLDALRKQPFAVVLLDIWLPGVDGLETLQRIREFDNPPEIVIISGHGTIETAVRATKLGAFDFLEKPLSLDRTLIVIKNAVEAHRLRAEPRLSRDAKRRNGVSALCTASPTTVRVDLRQIWHWEVAVGTGHPCPKPAQGRTICRTELRRHPRRAD
jgi:two-component system nitrogen regulation response regulator NtrX